VLALTALVIRSYWVIHKTEIPAAQAEFVTSPPPPPPPPPASKKPPKPPDPTKIQKVKVDEPVQPPEVKEDLTNVEVVEQEEGEETGVEGGQTGGVAEAPVAPTIVPPKVLEQNRVAGETQIQPPDEVKNQIRRDGKTRIVANAQLCLDATGNVKSVKLLKSSGYTSYDRKIQSAMSAWRYRPFQVNGEARPVCTAVTFIYSQTN
jgi:TonB family protein